MKKLLITSLLGLFGFFGAFASADYTFQWTVDWTYTPSQLVLTEILTIDSSNFSYTQFDWQFNSAVEFLDSNENVVCNINYEDDSLFFRWFVWDDVLPWYCILSAWTYDLSWRWMSFSSFTIIVRDSEWWDNSWSLLPWGESDLSWIITWLNSTITEFIPYLVYLGLWIITVIIWFVAVRWLINRTQAKIRWTFSSWRRRR